MSCLRNSCFRIRFSKSEDIWYYNGKYYSTRSSEPSEEARKRQKSIGTIITVVGSYLLLWFGIDYLNRFIGAFITNKVSFYYATCFISLITYVISIPVGRYISLRIINREGDLREDFSAEIVSLDIAEKEKKDTRSIIAAIIICTDIVLIVELLCKTMMLENPSFSLFSIICLSICGMALGAQSWLQKLQYMNQIIELHNNVDTKMGE